LGEAAGDTPTNPARGWAIVRGPGAASLPQATQHPTPPTGDHPGDGGADPDPDERLEYSTIVVPPLRMNSSSPDASRAAESRASESNYPTPVRYDTDDSGVRVREVLHSFLWGVPVTGGAASTAGAESRAPPVLARLLTAAAAENTVPVAVGSTAPGRNDGLRAIPTDASASGIEDVARHPVESPSAGCPTATAPAPEPARTSTPAEVPDPPDATQRTLLAGVIPFDLTAFEGETRGFLGRVAGLGADCAGEAGWKELAWLSIGALLAGGVTHTAVAHRRRNRTTI
jgi:hypothetical protein